MPAHSTPRPAQTRQARRAVGSSASLCSHTQTASSTSQLAASAVWANMRMVSAGNSTASPAPATLAQALAFCPGRTPPRRAKIACARPPCKA